MKIIQKKEKKRKANAPNIVCIRESMLQTCIMNDTEIIPFQNKTKTKKKPKILLKFRDFRILNESLQVLGTDLALILQLLNVFP